MKTAAVIFLTKLKMKSINDILTIIENHLDEKIIAKSGVGGGCISNALQLTTSSGKKYFAKINNSAPKDMFSKEANGLLELSKASVIKVPSVIFCDESFILLEYIEPASEANNFFEDFGRKFAMLHQHRAAEFGFFEDNYIGSTRQANTASVEEKNDWIKFYFNKRILFQYKLAEKNGFATSELRNGISMLENKIEEILLSEDKFPSLLHGDLWSGNFIIGEDGKVCLIDPAVYYGSREADLAMTKLFGGFPAAFYKAYNEYFPLSPGFEYRENLYKLYHVLNHLNLFGSSYYSQAISLLNFYF